MAEKRPYFHASTAELEEIYKNNKKDIPTLKKLLRELEHRSRPKARALHEQITKFLTLQNIDVACVEEDGPQQLSLYPPADKSPAKKQKEAPESVQCQLEGICPKSSKNDKIVPEAENPQAKENQLKSKRAENREANGSSSPEEVPTPRHHINLEKVVRDSPKKAPVTKENFWRFLFLLITGKK